VVVVVEDVVVAVLVRNASVAFYGCCCLV